MGWLKFLLGILEYLSIVVGSAAGIIGAISDTQDKINGKLNRFGRWLVGIFIMSLIVGLASQAIKSRLKDEEDRASQEKNTEMLKLIRGQSDKITEAVDFLGKIQAKTDEANRAKSPEPAKEQIQRETIAKENLAQNPIFTNLPENARIYLPGVYALKAAIAELKAGAREIGGNNQGSYVAKYLASVKKQPPQPWSVAFVSWAFSQGRDGAPFTVSAFEPDIFNAFNEKQWLHKIQDPYIPEPGDIVWSVSDSGNKSVLLGIVQDFQSNTVYTIQGNTEDGQDSGQGRVTGRAYQLSPNFVFGHVPATPKRLFDIVNKYRLQILYNGQRKGQKRVADDIKLTLEKAGLKSIMRIGQQPKDYFLADSYQIRYYERTEKETAQALQEILQQHLSTYSFKLFAVTDTETPGSISIWLPSDSEIDSTNASNK